jgi:hypothetical protein
MNHMTDPRSSAISRIAPIATIIAVGFGLVAGVATASAAPLAAGIGLGSPGRVTETVAYKRYKQRRLYLEDAYGPPSYPSYPRSSAGMPFGGSDEILELQRRFPQTLWPPSMRYFPHQ